MPDSGEYRRGHGPYFAQVPHALLKDKRSTAFHIATYAALRACADFSPGPNGGHRTNVSDLKVAFAAGCSERKVRECRQDLREWGWVDWDDRPGKTNIYFVHASTPARHAGHPGTTCRGTPAQDAGVLYKGITENHSTERQHRDVEKDFDESLELGIEKNGGDPIPRLWDIFIEELGGSGPKPSLSTGKRKKLLRALYREQLDVDDRDPFETFRRICRAVKNSEHHMSVRSYQMPESLFRNPERRERWTIEALSGGGRHWTEDI